MTGPDVQLAQQTRAAAFRLLLETGRPVSPVEIAAELNAAPSVVVAELGRLDAAGRIRLSAHGFVVGSAGLSVAPAAHDLWPGSRRFWTWCAYDIVGIVGTLEADARSLSRSPASGLEIELRFAAGRAPAGLVVLFLPDDGGSVRTVDDWCANANFFEDREAALLVGRAQATRRGHRPRRGSAPGLGAVESPAFGQSWNQIQGEPWRQRLT